MYSYEAVLYVVQTTCHLPLLSRWTLTVWMVISTWNLNLKPGVSLWTRTYCRLCRPGTSNVRTTSGVTEPSHYTHVKLSLVLICDNYKLLASYLEPDYVHIYQKPYCLFTLKEFQK